MLRLCLHYDKLNFWQVPAWRQHLDDDWYPVMFDDLLKGFPVTIEAFLNYMKAAIDIKPQMKSFIDHGLLKLRNGQIES